MILASNTAIHFRETILCYQTSINLLQLTFKPRLMHTKNRKIRYSIFILQEIKHTHTHTYTHLKLKTVFKICLITERVSLLV